MHLRIINSGSQGNCYILENDTTAIIIECGVPMKEIKRALDFNLNKVAGVLISHNHLDHCKAAKDIVAAGLDIYSSDGTIAAIGLAAHHRAFRLFNQTSKAIGEFKIIPFDVKHDAAEPFGFLIHHNDCGTVLFITDSFYIPYTFKNLNQIIIEANYDTEIVNSRMSSGDLHTMVRDRVIESHMNINTCLELLKANDLSAVNNICLVHLSDGNSNANDFKKQVEEATGKNVHVAERNMIIDFNKQPF